MKNWQEFKQTQNEWDELIVNFEGNYRQLYKWGELQESKGWEIKRYIEISNGEVTASVQILEKDFLLFKFFYVPGGISGNRGGFGDIKDLIRELFGFCF